MPRSIFLFVTVLLIGILSAACATPMDGDEAMECTDALGCVEVAADKSLVTETERDKWKGLPFSVLEISRGDPFGRDLVVLHAPDAVTREQRVGTLIAAATLLHQKREIGDVASLSLVQPELLGHGHLLARIVFAKDKCGWTRDDCTDDIWTDAVASAVQYTEEQIALYILYQEIYPLFDSEQDRLQYMASQVEMGPDAVKQALLEMIMLQHDDVLGSKSMELPDWIRH